MSPRKRTNGALAEKTVTVSGGANAITVRASGHSYVALVGSEGELVREQGGAPQVTLAADKGTYTVVSDGRIEKAAAETIDVPALPDPGAEAAALRLTADAPDRHAIDGVPEIAADGKAYCTISVEKIRAGGEPLTRKKDDDVVYLRSSAGSLTDKKGERVRSVRLRSGKAEVRLVSDPDPRVATVEALAEPPLGGAELKVEFV